ncbi:MAG: GerMN domain-containing protein [Lachnospiraceae bacterium]|nr:GerMN domain-containing protein [Lachnospiraceae bacterium]
MSKSKKKKKGKGKEILKYLSMVVVLALIVLAAILFISQKEKVSEEKNTIKINLYFPMAASSELKAESREISGNDEADILSNVLKELAGGPKTEGLSRALPENVKINSAKINGTAVTVDFSEEYSSLKSGEELLCRGSIVWTLTELDFIDSVAITVNGEPLLKSTGEEIGSMSRDDVVLDKEISPEPSSTVTVKLYFADSTASHLEVEERNIEANPNDIEKKILEQLITGPESNDLSPTVPPETKIRDVKVVDGICYVDLSMEFVTKHSGGSTGEALTIYSIVDSLTELSNVNKVQFLIEGEKLDEYKGHLDFGKPFEYTEY